MDKFIESLADEANLDQFDRVFAVNARLMYLYYSKLTTEGFAPKQAMQLVGVLLQHLLATGGKK